MWLFSTKVNRDNSGNLRVLTIIKELNILLQCEQDNLCCQFHLINGSQNYSLGCDCV